MYAIKIKYINKTTFVVPMVSMFYKLNNTRSGITHSFVIFKIRNNIRKKKKKSMYVLKFLTDFTAKVI